LTDTDGPENVSDELLNWTERFGIKIHHNEPGELCQEFVQSNILLQLNALVFSKKVMRARGFGMLHGGVTTMESRSRMSYLRHGVRV